MILHRIRAIAARTVLVCAAVALAPCLAGTAAVAGPPAGSDNRVGIAPADERDYTHISLPAGGTAKRPVQVTNFSTTAQDLLIYPADASITPQGGFALAERDAPLREVGAWAQLPVSQLHLAARSSKVVMFTLTVPTGTTPGDYAGGVVIQRARAGTASTVSNGVSVQLNIVERQGARIYLHVNGQTQARLQIGELTWKRDKDGGITFSAPVTNTGNIRLHPVAHLRVSGFRLPERDVPMSPIEELLPGSTVTVTGRLMPAPKFGIGRAVLTVDDGVGHKPTADVSLRLMPLWAALLVLVLLVMVTVVAVWLLEAWRRRRNRQAPRHRARRSARSRGGRAVQRPASV